MHVFFVYHRRAGPLVVERQPLECIYQCGVIELGTLICQKVFKSLNFRPSLLGPWSEDTECSNLFPNIVISCLLFFSYVCYRLMIVVSSYGHMVARLSSENKFCFAS